jgi:hypothetical protein
VPIQKQIDDSLLFVANMNFFEIIFPFAAFSSNDRSPTDVFYDICSAKSSAASAFGINKSLVDAPAEQLPKEVVQHIKKVARAV